MEFLRNHRITVLVCGSVLPDGNWKQLLEGLAVLPAPPSLIVTSKHADDALWAEVLNLGAYDVLSKPFDRAEVTRTISLAWLQKHVGSLQAGQLQQDHRMLARRRPESAGRPGGEPVTVGLTGTHKTALWPGISSCP